MRILSLGAGVQSTTIALMAGTALLPEVPDAAIFADTGAEPDAVYRHLDWLCEPGRLAFPVHRVSAGNLRDILLGDSKRRSHARPPLFVSNADGTSGIIRRQCTGDYKIDPIEKEIRRLIGLVPRQRWPKAPVVEQWLGISLDEATRMKPSRRPAITVRWPLIDLRMSRRDCLAWLERNGHPTPPKSACTFCPFHSDAEWRRLRDTDPKGWADAVAVDAAVRTGLNSKNLVGALYVHRSCKPLPEVDLSTAEERGQANLFENECAGVCGV